MRYVPYAAGGVRGRPGLFDLAGVEYFWVDDGRVGEWFFTRYFTSSSGSTGMTSYEVEGYFTIDGATYPRFYSGSAPSGVTNGEDTYRIGLRADLNQDGATLIGSVGWPWFTTLPFEDPANWPTSPYPADPLHRIWVSEWASDEAAVDGAWRAQRMKLMPFETGEGGGRIPGITRVGAPQPRTLDALRGWSNPASGVRPSVAGMDV